MSKPITENLTIVNKLGFHARAAAKFVRAAACYKSEVTLTKDGQEANGKSIMGVLMLGAGKGSIVTLFVHGVDQEAAFSELKQMIADRFGEEQ